MNFKLLSDALTFWEKAELERCAIEGGYPADYDVAGRVVAIAEVDHKGAAVATAVPVDTFIEHYRRARSYRDAEGCGYLEAYLETSEHEEA